MSDVIADYDRAADGFMAVLARVDGRWDAQSPCEDWTARHVADHVLGNTAGLIEALGGTVPGIEGDDVARYAELRRAVVEAAGVPGALERMVPGPLGGDMPSGVLAGIITTDTLLHTWDLSRALGDDVDLDAGLLHRSWQNIVPMDDMIRRPGVFGPKVAVGDDATPQQQALAFFGRSA